MIPINQPTITLVLISILISVISDVVGSSVSDPRLEYDYHEELSVHNLRKQISKQQQSQEASYSQRRVRLKRDAQIFSKQKNILKLRLESFNTTYVLVLEPNYNLLPSNFFVEYQVNGSNIIDYPHAKKSDDCHYSGRVEGRPNSWAAITICPEIVGTFDDGEQLYHMHPSLSSPSKVLIFRDQDKNGNAAVFKCGVKSDTPLKWKHAHNDLDSNYLTSVRNEYQKLPNGDEKEIPSNRSRRTPRSVTFSRVNHDAYKANIKSRYVELILVNDYKQYTDFNTRNPGRGLDVVLQRSKQIVNIVNALYNQLNVYVALVGVVIWTEKDEISLVADGDATLSNFLRYRRERLAPKHKNDNAQLITGVSFDAGVVGKALKGPICTFEYSGGVNTDQSHLVGVVATTVAHELGHNFGMEHDTEECKCPDSKLKKCIMAPSSNSMSPKRWSSCSVEQLQESFKHGMDYCLRNRPEQLVGPVCGNGFLEEGEECDCGLDSNCDNCCNNETCKLKPEAKCASGSCCDTKTCIPKGAGTACRPAKSECDLPEVCNGESEHCPDDVHVHDGIPCHGLEAYCAHGECHSHEDQCQLLWGQTGRMSDTRCYEQNVKGTANGNCGFNRLNQTYFQCKPTNVLCGTLHCVHMNERLEFGLESAATLARSFIADRGKILTCRSAVIDLGLDTVDPGLVPDGARCGREQMCYKQECVSVAAVLEHNPCPNNCFGNGICDNRGVCHCFEDYEGPDCEYIPGRHRMIVAFYVIFLCILPLTAISSFLIYYFHGHIKTWWMIKARKAAIKSRAKHSDAGMSLRSKSRRLPIVVDRQQLEISNPIPLQETSLNGISGDESGECDANGHVPSFVTMPRNVRKERGALRDLTISPPITSTIQNLGCNAANFNTTSVGNTMNHMTSTMDGHDGRKPSRPAPPPPTGNHLAIGSSSTNAASKNFQRSASLRASQRKDRPLSLQTTSSRPKAPPPPRPPPPPPHLEQHSTTSQNSSISHPSQNSLNGHPTRTAPCPPTNASVPPPILKPKPNQKNGSGINGSFPSKSQGPARQAPSIPSISKGKNSTPSTSLINSKQPSKSNSSAVQSLAKKFDSKP